MTPAVTAPGSAVLDPAASFDPLPPDLVPAPAEEVAYAGGLGSIYELLSQQRSLNLEVGTDGVKLDQQAQDTALANELSAIRREEQNQSSSGEGFFGSIGKLVTDVARDVVHGRLGDALGDAGSDLSAAWSSPRFWSDLQNGLEDISVVGASISEVAQQLGGPVGTMVAAASASIDQGAELGADLAGAREQTFSAAAQSAEADALASKTDLGRFQKAAQGALDDAKGNDESLARALDDVAEALSTNDRTLVSSTAVKG